MVAPPVPGEGAPVDARGATGVQVGAGNTQIVYSYNGLTFGDGVAPPPLATFTGHVESPYRGLAAFGERDAAFFFGRESAASDVLDRMADRCRQGGVLVVSGVSGAGKSSLLNAGVLPRLRGAGLAGFPGSSGWPCLVFTPAARPLDDLAVRVATLSGVAASAVRRELQRDPASFGLLARQAAMARQGSVPDGGGTSPRLVLVVDQFEQVFTQCRDEAQRRAFVAALASAATDERSPVGLVVLGVRADFEAACAEQPELVDAVQRRYLVTSMTERQLRMAITQPATTAGSGVDPDLVEALVHDVHASRGATAAGPAPRVTGAGVLPLVSHALDRAWRTRTGERLTLADYERSGGVEGAVAASAQQAYDGLTPGQQQLARQLFLRLTVTNIDGVPTADRVRLPELLQGRNEDEQHDVRTVLDAFVEERLLTLAADTVEISHEVLFTAWPLLRDTWLADAQADRVHRARLDATVREWLAHGQDASYLYSGSLLESATETAARIRRDPARHAPLAASTMQFLETSTHAARRRTRRRRTLVAVLVVLVLGLGAAAVLATVAQRSAGRQRDLARATARVATARQLASTAVSELDSDLGQSMLLAATSWHLDRGVEERSALWQAASASPHLVRLVPLGAPAESVGVAHDGSVTAVGDSRGRVTLISPRGQVSRVLRMFTGPVRAVAVADGGTRVLATDGRQVVSATGSHVAPVAQHRHEVSAVALSAGGARAVYVDDVSALDSRSAVHTVVAGASASAASRTVPAAIDHVTLHGGKLTLLDGSYGKWFLLRADLTGPAAQGDPGFGAHNYSVALAPDGGSFSYTNSAGSVPVWRTRETGERFQTTDFYGQEPGVVPQALALAPGGRRMAVADSGTLYVSRVHAGQAADTPTYVATLTGLSRREVSNVSFMGSPDRLVSTSDDQVAVWDLRQFSRIATSQRSRTGFSCVACEGPTVSVSTGSRVASLSDQGANPVVHDFSTGRELYWKDTSLSWGPQLWSATSPTTLLQVLGDGSIGSLDATTGRWRATWPAVGHTDLLYLHWVDGGHRLLTVDTRGVTRMRDARTGKVLRSVQPAQPLARSTTLLTGQVAISDDGRYLALVEGRRVVVRDLRSRRVVARLVEPPARVQRSVTVRFADGHRLFVFRDGAADIVQAVGGRRLGRVRLDNGLEPPTVDPAGSTIAYQQLGGRLVLIDVASGREVGGFPLPASVEALKSGYGFSPDGRQLVVVTEGSGTYGRAARWQVSVQALHTSVCRTAARRLTRNELHALSPQLTSDAC